MGNNRSNLISGSTATTASLNSTSSLPVNPMSASASLQPHTNSSSQSSVSFLKRFRNTNPSSQNCDELDNIDSNPAHRRKNKKLNTFTKKLKKPDSVDDFTSEANKNSKSTMPKNQKRIDKNKMISLSASNITKNSKVSTNESEYTTINEYAGDTADSVLKPSGNIQTQQPLIISHIKEESFYESTFDMDLPSTTNKENERIQVKRASKTLAASPTDKTNTNIYSEIVTKPHIVASGYSGLKQPMPPTNPPPQANNNNKKNHLQPITNFFNKLTKTTAKLPIDIVHTESVQSVAGAQAPVVPAKAFNPTKEFYSDYNPVVRRFNAAEIEDEEDEDDGGIYSKIDKSNTSHIRTSNIPPLPTTLVPSTLLTDEIESCLKLKSNDQNYSEYQSVQEYDYIEKPVGDSPVPKAILYTPIEPLNINNQVYYSFASDSQEQFDLQNDYISRIDVKPNSQKSSSDTKKFTMSLNESDMSLKENIPEKLNLIDEIKGSQVEASNNYTVKL